MKTFLGLIVPVILGVTWYFAGPTYAVYVIVGAAVCMAGVAIYDVFEGRARRRREPRSPLRLE